MEPVDKVLRDIGYYVLRDAGEITLKNHKETIVSMSEESDVFYKACALIIEEEEYPLFSSYNLEESDYVNAIKQI